MKLSHLNTSMRRKALFMAILTMSALGVSGCGNSAAPARPMHTRPLNKQDLLALSKKTLFFGHQSVGYNMVEGIQDILREHGDVAWDVVEAPGTAGIAKPALVHSTVGRNTDPASKIDDFSRRISSTSGKRPDIAFFKFCYADIDKVTDAQKVFEKYRSAMSELARTHPDTRFIHLTVPLKATGKGWKAQVKSLIGRHDVRIADNLRLEEFNQFLRKEYGESNLLFDLAMLEATRPDGTLVHDSLEGRMVPSLSLEYTYDSGHLNERGRKYIAERFLAFLAAL